MSPPQSTYHEAEPPSEEILAAKQLGQSTQELRGRLYGREDRVMRGIVRKTRRLAPTASYELLDSAMRYP